MNSLQEVPTAAFPPPCFVQDSGEPNRAGLATNKDNTDSNQFANDDPVAKRPKGVSPRESYGDQELSRVNKVTPLLAPKEVLPERCQFTFSDGRQCRMQRSEIHPRLCRFHKEREEEELFGTSPSYDTLAALALPELEAAARDLTTLTGVNRALGQVFRLLAQRRISRQEAVAFGYLAQLMLQTISAAKAESVAAQVFEGNVKPNLETMRDEGPGACGGENKQPVIPAVERQKGVSSRGSSSPINNVSLNGRPHPDRVPLPDYQSLPSRSLDVAQTPTPPNPQEVQNEHLHNFST